MTRDSPPPAYVWTTGRSASRARRCKSGCCRRETEGCESHCAPKGSEGSTRHPQTFLGLYNECPRLLNLTCVFPKNEKSFNIIYGRFTALERDESDSFGRSEEKGGMRKGEPRKEREEKKDQSAYCAVGTGRQ
ncbi:colipase-like protein 1 isoform X2 [Leopardus geoffroyi]|uniref:colipase-like protein 1 isoform X2 n=1 Tax=Leopardus geoffroyi TaxID=46844 RepID=UPI001E25FA71|nr:colipase-like protein 1 isoform X2 [Leopardus geoffroyi]